MNLKKNLIKSFLTLAIWFLFLSNWSFLTNAEDTLFSIEWMNMSQTNWWWGWWWDTAAIVTEIMRQLSQAWVIQWWTWAWQNWIYRWNWTTFDYERRVAATTWNWDWSDYRTAIKEQMQTFISAWSYTWVENVDLDNDWHEEIVVTNWDDVLIYEWNWTTFKWSKFYTLDKTNKNQTFFLRLEDEYWNKIYYLMVYRASNWQWRWGYRKTVEKRYYNDKWEYKNEDRRCSRCTRDSASFKLYAKWDNSYTNRQPTQRRWYAYDLIHFLHAWDWNKYWYDSSWKFFFKNDDWVKEYYTYNWNNQNIWWRTVYRYVKDSSYTWWSTVSFATATSSEKKPYTTWNTIAHSEYDKFIQKTNSDWTYNYKITLENPDWEQVVAFYWLNFNGIIFKDLNNDWVKDIMTYEDYISEDNVQFKRIYIFMFDETDYIYKKVMDWVDTIQYQWQDVDDDWDLDIFIRRYDEKLNLYRNNWINEDFSHLWAVRWKYFLFKDLIHNWKHQLITKNMSNNDVAWEWKIYNVDWEWYFNTTWTIKLMILIEILTILFE